MERPWPALVALILFLACLSTPQPVGAQNLIYTTLDGQGMPLRCMRLLLRSIAHYTPQPQFTFLAFVSNDTLHHIHRFTAKQPWPIPLEYHVLDPREVDKPNAKNTINHATMWKWELWRWPRINEFKKVLYLDLDMIMTLNMNKVFELPLQPGILYAGPERFHEVMLYRENPFKAHNHLLWRLGNGYSDEQLEVLRKNDIHVFNSGLFLFFNTPEMQQHFAGLRSLYWKWTKGYHFNEQSFFNHYFNSRLISNVSLLEPIYLEYWAQPGAWDQDHAYANKIIHFYGSDKGKEKFMRETYLHRVHNQRNSQSEALYPWLDTLTRTALKDIPRLRRGAYAAAMEHIGQAPKQVQRYMQLTALRDERQGFMKEAVCTICVVGVQAGHTTAVFAAAHHHATFFAFDSLNNPYSTGVMKLFRHIFPEGFHFVRGPTHETLPWMQKNHPSDKCDLAAVDGDHSYEGTLTDLLNVHAMARNGSTLVVDRVSERFAGVQRAFEEFVAAGYITQVECEQAGPGELRGAGATGVRRWCWGVVARPSRRLTVPLPADSSLSFALDTK